MTTRTKILVAVGLALLAAALSLPGIPVIGGDKVTAVTYVFEKDRNAAVPSPVLYALDKLNREMKIPATIFEYDTTDGTNQVAEQYKPVVEAVTKDDLPALVVLSNMKVLHIVKSPKTEEAVYEVVK